MVNDVQVSELINFISESNLFHEREIPYSPIVNRLGAIVNVYVFRHIYVCGPAVPVLRVVYKDGLYLEYGWRLGMILVAKEDFRKTTGGYSFFNHWEPNYDELIEFILKVESNMKPPVSTPQELWTHLPILWRMLKQKRQV